MTALSDTHIQLMQLISIALFTGKREDTEQQREIHWRELYRESLQQGVFTLIYPVVEAELPPEVQGAWRNTYYSALTGNLRVDYEYTEMHSILAEAGIPYVSLKGVASASYYPEPELRMMGDVDFLVRREDVARTGRLLESSGFERESGQDGRDGKTDGIHTGYHRTAADGANISSWELHWSVNGIPDGEAPEELLGAMICDIFDGGNFGRKAPALRPVGWICTVVQYLDLVRRGERRMDRKETLENAAVRKQIYRQFQLFEPVSLVPT
jgi:hypothetical protein